jgi:hypothetical protein
MSEVKQRFDRATASFVPTVDWYEGALARVRRRRRNRRYWAGAMGLVLFGLSFGSLLTTLGPGSIPGGGPACLRSFARLGSPPAPGGLTDVAVLSPTEVWAVGPDGEVGPGSHALTQRFHDGAWEAARAVDGSTGPGAINHLAGVAAIASDDVWAVGMTAEIYPLSPTDPGRALVEHWDGRSWSLVPAPSPSSIESRLHAVSGVASDDVWAVGHRVEGTIAIPMIQHWDGTEWSIVPNPEVVEGGNGGDLEDVIAFASDDVWAVGSQPSGVLIEHWDGSRWSVVDAPDIGEHAYLTAIDGSSPTDVWTVGWTTTGGFDARPTPPVVLRFDGSSWASVRLPTSSDRYVVPLAVTAVGPGDVWVSGWTSASNSTNELDTFRPFVAHWDGVRWRFVDHGIELEGSVINASATDGRSVWFVGRHGGTYTDVHALLEGADAMTVAATCV